MSRLIHIFIYITWCVCQCVLSKEWLFCVKILTKQDTVRLSKVFLRDISVNKIPINQAIWSGRNATLFVLCDIRRCQKVVIIFLRLIKIIKSRHKKSRHLCNNIITNIIHKHSHFLIFEKNTNKAKPVSSRHRFVDFFTIRFASATFCKYAYCSGYQCNRQEQHEAACKYKTYNEYRHCENHQNCCVYFCRTPCNSECKADSFCKQADCMYRHNYFDQLFKSSLLF